MTALALAISRALIHFVWQGSIVGLLLWAILFALRKRSANARYLASCAALAVLSLMPVLTAWRLYGRPATAISRAARAAPFSQAFMAMSAGSHSQQLVWLAWLQSWALPVWSLGVLLFSARLVLGYKHAFTMGRRGDPANDSVIGMVTRLSRAMGVHRPIRVLISSITDTPSVVGWLRPIILLPAATLMGLTPFQLEAIVAHEIGHIKRYDYLVNMIQMLAETLLFYHPAVWWTSKRIRLERELCCDDLAVRFSGNALRYARALTTLEKLRLRSPGVAMASTGGPLLYRIQRIAGVTAKDYGPSRLPAVLAIALGVLCIAFNVSWVRGQDAPGVKVDLGSSAVIHRTPVPYPEAVQKEGITGTVQVEVKLDATGDVADARVLSGPEELRKTALGSVLNWHFTNEAAKSTRLINISFSDKGQQVQVLEPKTLTAVVNGEVVSLNFIDEARRHEELQDKLTAAQKADQQKRELLAVGELRSASGLTERQQLERQMAELKAQAAAASQNAAQDSIRAEYKARLYELQRRFEETNPPGALVPSKAVGRAVKNIAIIGLSDSARNDLTARLPVRVGDTLSADSFESVKQAVREYDDHLVVGFLLTIDGQAELRISVGKERGVIEGSLGGVR